MKRWLLILTAVFVLSTGSANAQTRKNGPMAKLPHSLVALHQQHIAHVTQQAAMPFISSDPLVRLVADRVVIDAIASGNVDTLKADLEFLGMQDAVAFGRIISGQLPISSIAAAGALATLRFAQPALAVTNAGTVTSQGDQAMRSDVTRTAFGVNGTGIQVGVLSDSFNCLGDAATDIANDDLSPVMVLQEDPGCSSGTDEGRAMLQIVHDVAPGSSLAFATAHGGQATFAGNIVALKNNGAKVIVDDVIYLAEPFFKTELLLKRSIRSSQQVPLISPPRAIKGGRAIKASTGRVIFLATAQSHRLQGRRPSSVARHTISYPVAAKITSKESRSPGTLPSLLSFSGIRRFSRSAGLLGRKMIWTFTFSIRTRRWCSPRAHRITWEMTPLRSPRLQTIATSRSP